MPVFLDTQSESSTALPCCIRIFSSSVNTWPHQANRTFRGKRLSDDECARLCAGEEIEITGLKSQSGSEYGVIGT